MKNLVESILKVTFGTNELYEFEGDEVYEELQDSVKEFVRLSKAKEIEFTISKDLIQEINMEESDFDGLTDAKINFIEADYSDFIDMAENLIPNDMGRGYNGINRDYISYNENYFFTGSDATFYILAKKIA